MNKTHIVTALVFILIGYLLATYFPGIGNSVKSTVSGLVG